MLQGVGTRRRRALVAPLVGAGLALAPAAPAGAIDTGTPFDTLRGDIMAGAPPVCRQPLLAKVDLARDLASGTGRFPPNPCASANVLDALDHQVAGLAGANGFEEDAGAAIRADLATLLGLFPPSPCHGAP